MTSAAIYWVTGNRDATRNGVFSGRLGDPRYGYLRITSSLASISDMSFAASYFVGMVSMGSGIEFEIGSKDETALMPQHEWTFA